MSALASSSESELQAVVETLDRKDCEASACDFIERHCFIEEPDGTAVPFKLWDFQRDVVVALEAGEPVIVLKARRLGLSWLVLCFALWLAIFNQGTRILVLCKTEGDATELLDRIRRTLDRIRSDPASQHILSRLERPAKERDAVKTLDVGASTIRALVGTPAAARSETAGLVIADEFAFQSKADHIWQALAPTIEGGGKLAVVSTGNGRSGDGQTFFKLWTEGTALTRFFFPWQARPDRDEDWKERQLRLLGDPDRFRVEYPEAEDDAFRSANVITVYPVEGIHAAVELGRRYEAEGAPDPAEGTVELAIDWGEHTFALIIRPLAGGGVYVEEELVFESIEPGAASTRMLSRLGAQAFPAAKASYDAAGIQAMRTFQAMRDQTPGLTDLKTDKIAFGKWKEETIGYLKRLFNRTHEGRELGVIAINPNCETLIRQLLAYQLKDPDQGRVLKKDDHGPDALIAGMARRAAHHRTLIDQET